MKNKRSLEGYLLIDNRISPATVGEGSYDSPQINPGGIYESATITCSHCHTVVIINPQRTRPRNYCSKCDHYVCDNKVCNEGCYPLNARFEDELERIAKNG